MPDDTISYTREAFMHPANLAFLLVAMLTVFFTVGLSPIPEVVLTFALAAELLFLGTVPRNERFQRAIRANKAAETKKAPTEQDVFRQLTKASQKRYLRFRKLEEAMRANYERLSHASQGLVQGNLRKIDGLLDAYLQMLWQKERYERFLAQAKEDKVTGAIADLRAEIEQDPPRVAEIKQKRLDILRRRLDRFKKAGEHFAVLEAQLETIEDVTKYIHEQSLTMRDPEELSFQLDTLMAEVEETQAAVTEVEDVFTRSSDLLGDIDVFSSESTTPGRRNRLRS